MKKLLIIIILLGIATTAHANFLNSGLVSYWTFDRKDLGTNSLRDRGSANLPAFLTGMATSTAVSVGKQGQALSFDHIDDYVTIPNFTALNGTSAMTICAWNFINNLGTTGDIADGSIFARNVAVSSDSMILFWYNVNGAGSGDRTYSFNVGVTGSLGNRVNGLIRPRAKTWNHVCGIMNGTKRALYVNGVSDSSVTTGVLTTYPSSSVEAIIGAAPLVSANMLFDGLIDDVRVYNRELSATEINNLFRYGLSKHN